jgi:siroheme synthase
MQHRLRIAAEIGAGHRHDVHLVPRDELAEVLAELVVRVGRNVVELVHGDQPVVERLHAELLHREAEGGMGADQHLVVASRNAFTA